MNVSNRVALITGAGSGIGRAIALSLAKRGCHLALADVNKEGLTATADQAQQAGVPISTHVLDVSDRTAVEALPQKVLTTHEAIDLLINNAGIAAGGPFEQTSEEHFDRVMEVNFHAVVRLTRAFLPHLQKRDEARIVYLSSLYGLVAPPEKSAYAASKFAVRGFANALRHELEETNVGLTVVHPGGVNTEIARSAFVPEDASDEDIRTKREAEQRLLKMPPEKAGEIIVKAISKNKARVLVGSDAKMVALLERFLPVSYWKVLQRLTALMQR